MFSEWNQETRREVKRNESHFNGQTWEERVKRLLLLETQGYCKTGMPNQTIEFRCRRQYCHKLHVQSRHVSVCFCQNWRTANLESSQITESRELHTEAWCTCSVSEATFFFEILHYLELQSVTIIMIFALNFIWVANVEDESSLHLLHKEYRYRRL